MGHIVSAAVCQESIHTRIIIDASCQVRHRLQRHIQSYDACQFLLYVDRRGDRRTHLIREDVPVGICDNDPPLLRRLFIPPAFHRIISFRYLRFPVGLNESAVLCSAVQIQKLRSSRCMRVHDGLNHIRIDPAARCYTVRCTRGKHHLRLDPRVDFLRVFIRI